MRIHVFHIVLFCAIVLILLNIFALTLFSPGSQHNCQKQCSETYQFLSKTILNLKKELHQAKTEAKTNYKIPPNYKTPPTLYNDNNNHTIHMITPTYSRWTQKADLTRLAQTLMHVPNLHWIVIEDSDNKTNLVTRFLDESPLRTTHLNIRTRKELQRIGNQPVWTKSRGVEQRNIALEWLRTHGTKNSGDIVYFGDDDNTYDLKLFHEIRSTKKLAVWPVGICGGLKWEGPVCNEKGKVMSWHTSWAKNRPFPIDFAGFAIKLDVILNYPSVVIDPNAHIGWLESKFLSQMVTPDEAEGRADSCTKVLVWHTRTEKPKTKDEDKLIAKGMPSNPAIEV